VKRKGLKAPAARRKARAMQAPALVLALPLALSACAISHDVVAPPTAERPNDAWRQLATEEDRARFRGWRDAWTASLARARGAHREAIAAEGALLEPDAALEGPAIPAGDYRCRTIKLGAASAGLPEYNAYPQFLCRVTRDGARLRFTKIGGSQRPTGVLFPDSGRRMVFLGTLQLGDETLSLRYGRDRERDMIGLLERVGEARWRLVFPSPHFESLLDVIELVPAN
jgi:hypothetical protein